MHNNKLKIRLIEASENNMVEAKGDSAKKTKKNKLEPDDRYLGLSRHEVALRARMA